MFCWVEENQHAGLNPKMAGGESKYAPPCAFSKYVSSKKRLKAWFFVTFNIIISNIYPENFIEITQVVQNLWRISLSILAIFINFLDFLTFPFYKETNDASL